MSVGLLIFIAHASLTVFFTLIGAITRRSAPFLLLSVLLWLFSFPSAVFVWWGWLERLNSDRWAAYGLYYVSVPIIASNGVSALLAFSVAVFRDIEGFFRPLLYALFMFLSLQIALSIQSV